MALIVSEYTRTALVAQIRTKPQVEQEVAVGEASAATTNAVGATTKFVRLCSTASCHISIGPSPTATTAMFYLPAGAIEDIEVIGGVDKIAAIAAA